jgi:CDP-diacylglycerol---glycerol-3-phosphate 3-phosphatidyltransferase
MVAKPGSFRTPGGKSGEARDLVLIGVSVAAYGPVVGLLRSLASKLIEPPFAGNTRPKPGPEPWFTWANVVTVVRTVIGLYIFTMAALLDSSVWNFVGLGVYWALDIADGNLARWLKQETRIGAQLDILSDRVLVIFFYFNYVGWHPEILVPMALFMFQFAFIDHYLSNQFMRWPILSPNYFYEVDRQIWLLNWTTLAKFINGMLMTILLVVTHSVWIASIISIIMIGVKVYSVARLWTLPQPEDFLRRPAAEPSGA